METRVRVRVYFSGIKLVWSKKTRTNLSNDTSRIVSELFANDYLCITNIQVLGE